MPSPEFNTSLETNDSLSFEVFYRQLQTDLEKIALSRPDTIFEETIAFEYDGKPCSISSFTSTDEKTSYLELVIDGIAFRLHTPTANSINQPNMLTIPPSVSVGVKKTLDSMKDDPKAPSVPAVMSAHISRLMSSPTSGPVSEDVRSALREHFDAEARNSETTILYRFSGSLEPSLGAEVDIKVVSDCQNPYTATFLPPEKKSPKSIIIIKTYNFMYDVRKKGNEIVEEYLDKDTIEASEPTPEQRRLVLDALTLPVLTTDELESIRHAMSRN